MSLYDFETYRDVADSLKATRRWCVWSKSEDGRKIPFMVNSLKRGKKAKSNNPTTWTDFETACLCAEANASVQGISFALGDGFIGFDFDNCVNDTGIVHPDVVAWNNLLIADARGYTERSQSGKGLKTIVRGELSKTFLGTAQTGRQFKDVPAPGMAVEVYCERRFFFLTGNCGMLRGELRHDCLEQQAAIDSICDDLLRRKPPPPQFKPTRRVALTFSDQQILEKITNSRQADKFEKLWQGDTSDYASASEADMALTSILMFWCQNDVAQAERIFARSELARREKWDREDYRNRTLSKAHGEVYQPKRSEVSADALKKRFGGKA